MTITIELPEDKQEADFVLQLLQKLNIVFKQDEPTTDALQELLEERLADLKQNPHEVILWEDIKKLDLQAP